MVRLKMGVICFAGIYYARGREIAKFRTMVYAMDGRSLLLTSSTYSTS